MLSEEEKVRYTRQILLKDWGLETQEQLKNSTVFVGGAGGSGSPIITQLALLGVGCIRICDFDVVELSNLNRQFLHSVSHESRIGMNKAISAKKTVNNLNPNVKVEIFTDKINESNIDEMVGNADIIFDSVDKIDIKFILSRCAMKKNIPHLFYGMMDINAFFCTFYPPETPCFHCLYDYDKVQEIMNVSGKFQSVQKRITPVCCSSVVLSTGFAITEALKILLGVGEPAYNKFYFFLQKGNETIGKSKGFLGMTFWMSDFFKKISLEQGFNMDIGWRNNFIEELTIHPDQKCQYCSKD